MTLYFNSICDIRLTKYVTLDFTSIRHSSLCFNMWHLTLPQYVTLVYSSISYYWLILNMWHLTLPQYETLDFASICDTWLCLIMRHLTFPQYVTIIFYSIGDTWLYLDKICRNSGWALAVLHCIRSYGCLSPLWHPSLFLLWQLSLLLGRPNFSS